MHKTIVNPRSAALLTILIVGLICIGLFRIYLTYNVYSQTWDEPAHIAAGMEWLERGQYTYEPFHPPLARVMSALGPYVAGLRGTTGKTMWDEGNSILRANGSYEHNLTLARLGILPFFVIAALVVAVWSHSYGGPLNALFAVILFTTLPSILGHAGVAALDMACAALVSAALFALHKWIDKPSFLAASLLGALVGLAVLAKFSALVFLIASGALLSAAYLLNILRDGRLPEALPREMIVYFRPTVIALALFCLTVWAGYQFSVLSVDKLDRPHATIDNILGTENALRGVAYALVENVPIPAPEFIIGIRQFLARNDEGHIAYFLGDIQSGGWWHFNPIVLFLKTPVPFTILAAIGIFFALREVLSRRKSVGFLTPVVSLAGILAIGMLGSVNNGTRQMLAVYPLAAILAGYGAWRLTSWTSKRHRPVGIGIVSLLLIWHVSASIAAHPDYLPYFNLLAAKHPERITVDSDLDWGQDLKRLSDTLKERNAESVKIRYNGSIGIDFDDFGFPPWQILPPSQETKGWIAISVFNIQLGTKEPPYDQFSWLKELEPIEKVGKSIYLYYIPEE